MSTIPDDAQEIDLLAGEYVLGTLESRRAAEVRAALPGHAALRLAVEAWERRLDGMTDLVAGVAPPAGLWSRIEAAIAPAPNAAPMRPGLFQSLAFWRWSTAALAAGAAGLALLLASPRTPSERYVAVLQGDRAAPAWIVEARDQGIVLTALNPRLPDPSRVLQLWGLPQGATVPTSLGLIPASGRVEIARSALPPQAGMLVEISLEPPGGSPTGRPTGPILFIGRLEPAPPLTPL